MEKPAMAAFVGCMLIFALKQNFDFHCLKQTQVATRKQQFCLQYVYIKLLLFNVLVSRQ